MAIVSNSCTAPGSIRVALLALSNILGITVTLTEGDDVVLTVVTKHALTASEVTNTFAGPVEAIQAMCAQVPTAGMWSDGASMWIEECVAALGGKKTDRVQFPTRLILFSPPLSNLEIGIRCFLQSFAHALYLIICIVSRT